MEAKKQHHLNIKATTFLLLPMLVFLLLSCPVKRSLLSSFTPDTVSSFKTAIQYSCSHYTSGKKAASESVSASFTPSYGADISYKNSRLKKQGLNAFHHLIQQGNKRSPGGKYFIWHQSFLI